MSFFYCISLDGSCRVQQGDIRAIEIMTKTFSSEIWKKAVVVFTHANELEEKKTVNCSRKYWSVIQKIKETMVEALQKEHVPKGTIDELPMLTAGYTDPILKYEAGECNSVGGWDNRLLLAALKQVNPALLPALDQVRWSWKALVEALGVVRGKAARGATTGTIAGAVVGAIFDPVGVATGAGVGALTGAVGGASLGILVHQLVKVISILRIMYRRWQTFASQPVHPHKAIEF